MLFLNRPHCHVARETWAGVFQELSLIRSMSDSLSGKYLQIERSRLQNFCLGNGEGSSETLGVVGPVYFYVAVFFKDRISKQA